MSKGKVKMSEYYQPLSDYVLLPHVEVQKTEGGIILPDIEIVAKQTRGEKETMEHAIERVRASRGEQFFFEVLAVGPDARFVKEGNYVIMAPGARAAVFEIAGTKYVQCREMELFAIVTAEFIELDKAYRLAQSNSTYPTSTPLSASELVYEDKKDEKAKLTVVH